jgi:hypothetical protein
MSYYYTEYDADPDHHQHASPLETGELAYCGVEERIPKSERRVLVVGKLTCPACVQVLVDHWLSRLAEPSAVRNHYYLRHERVGQIAITNLERATLADGAVLFKFWMTSPIHARRMTMSATNLAHVLVAGNAYVLENRQVGIAVVQDTP